MAIGLRFLGVIGQVFEFEGLSQPAGVRGEGLGWVLP